MGEAARGYGGEMPEWFKGPVCKIGALTRVGGSNPSLPTRHPTTDDGPLSIEMQGGPSMTRSASHLVA